MWQYGVHNVIIIHYNNNWFSRIVVDQETAPGVSHSGLYSFGWKVIEEELPQ